MIELPVHFLAGQNYDCVLCGKCCTDAWDVEVDQETLKALEATELLKKVRMERGEPFRFQADKQRYVVAGTPDHSCIFLENSADHPGCKVCGIHGALGYKAKPHACQSFPFIVVETPDDVRVAISHYCTAAQRNVGRPLHVHQEALVDVRRMVVGKDPIRVFDDIYMDWDGYKTLTKFMQPDRGESWETVFFRSLLGVAAALVQVPEGAPRLLAQDLLSDELADAPDCRQHEPRAWFVEHMTFCLNGITTFLECASTEEVQRLDAALTEGGPVEFVKHQWRGNRDELLTFRTEPLPAELQEWLEHYLGSLVFRHYLATRGPLLPALLVLYLNAAIIRQYSRVFAARAERPLDRSHLQLAIDVCEKDMMHHGRGYENTWRLFAEALRRNMVLGYY